MLLVRGVVDAKLPTSISRDDFEWPEEVAKTTTDATAQLQRQIDLLDQEIRILGRRIP